jgi:hypothetical protein
MGCFLSLFAFLFLSLSLHTVAGASSYGYRNSYERTPYPQDWEMKDLFSGNRRFVHNVNVEYPDLLEQNGQNQQPPFMYIGCVDSR